MFLKLSLYKVICTGSSRKIVLLSTASHPSPISARDFKRSQRNASVKSLLLAGQFGQFLNNYEQFRAGAEERTYGNSWKKAQLNMHITVDDISIRLFQRSMEM